MSRTVTFLVFVWVLGQMLALILEGSWFGAQDQEALNPMLTFLTVKLQDPGPWGVVALFPAFFVGLFSMLAWDYSFLQGELALVKWVLLYPLSAGAVVAVAQLTIPAITGVVGLFRRTP